MPIAKPDQLPRWASVLVNNSANNTPNVQEPPEDKKDIGWNFLEKPPRQWVNWLALKTYQWLLWSSDSIDDLYNTINGVASVPTGTILDFGGLVAPPGYLLCDGSQISRTTYVGLFAVIGTTYGAGDGSTTFNLPDVRGRTAIGMGTGSGLSARTLGQLGGAEAVTLTINEIPPHNHNVNVYVQHDDASGGNENVIGGGYTNSVTTSTTGGGKAHQNMQPFIVFNKIIKI